MAALDAAFPARSPLRNDSLPDLMWLGGQREVIDFLQAKFDEMYEQSDADE